MHLQLVAKASSPHLPPTLLADHFYLNIVYIYDLSVNYINIQLKLLLKMTLDGLVHCS